MRTAIWLGCIMIGSAIENLEHTNDFAQGVAVIFIVFLIMDIVELVKK